jgi:hypothetical protein
LNIIEEMENRFLEISGIECDLSKFPLESNDIKNNIKVDKEKSDQYGEVFTPLWLVDKMILKATVEKLHASKSTLDLCAGYGQFTIRMIRALANYDKDFDVYKWLRENHTFIELQLESAHSILYTFGIDINLFIGDACKFIEALKQSKRYGIFYYTDHWNIITNAWLKRYMHPNELIFVNRILKKFQDKGELLTF